MQTMTKKAVEKLLAETSHLLTVDDIDLIQELDEIAAGLSGKSKTERRILRQPFELCGLLFYPLTVAKTMWHAEKVAEWELTPVQSDGLLFWLLTIPNNGDLLDEYSDQRKADKAVRRICRKLNCTQDEMQEVYYKCLGYTPSGETGGGEPLDYGGTIAALIREYGGTPEGWLYETPVEMISDLFRVMNDRIMAEESAHRAAAAKGGKAIAPTPSPKLAALNNFRMKVTAIRELWSKQDGE